MDLIDSQIKQDSNFIESKLIDNRYEVVELLEQSENEALFLVKDRCLEDEEILLKVFHIFENTPARVFSRFKNELVIARKLSHPNIARVYDIGKLNSRDYYLTTEKHGGCTLDSLLLECSNGMDTKLALNILYEIALALEESHFRKIIHRGVSAQNIFVSISENKLEDVYLTGFGFGKVLGANFGLTQTGEILGSPSYMAPEQLRGEEVDHRIDIFALGTLAFEMFTGRKPYEELGSSPLVLMRAQQKLPLIKNYRSDIPEWVDEIVAKMLALDKDERYHSAKDIIRDILVRSGISNAKRKSKKKRKIKRSALVFGLFSLLFTFATILFVSSGMLNRSSAKHDELVLNEELVKAINAGEESKVFQILKKGANLHVKYSGEPLVCLAAQRQNVNVMYTLLNYDQSIVNEQGNNGQSPLIIAVLKNNKDMVELLLNYNADTQLRDKNDRNAIDYAAEAGKTEIMNLFKS